MKKLILLTAVVALTLCGCSSSDVKVRGDLSGFEGVARIYAELPGEGMTIVAEQQVDNGKIELSTDQLVLPARVWLYFNNGTDEYVRDFILDQKDKCSIRGKGKFLDQMTITGSALNKEYLELKGQFKEKYDGSIESSNKKIAKLRAKENPTQTDRLMLNFHEQTRDKNIAARFRFSKNLVELNPDMLVSLFVLKDMLADSVDIQRAVFNNMKIDEAGKESNIYKVLDSYLNGPGLPVTECAEFVELVKAGGVPDDDDEDEEEEDEAEA